MLSLKKVAVTGGLSCGKSSVCRFFKELGAQVVNADEIVHRLLSPKTSVGKRVVALLGKDIIVNGKIDRSIVAKKVFNDPTRLNSLQKLIHPAVLSEIEKQYRDATKKGQASLFVVEIPLLFEITAEGRFDVTIAVWADHEASKQRFKTTTGYDDKEYDRRMANQLPPDEKAKRADYVIKNSGTLEQMRAAVSTLFNQLTT